MNELIIKNIAHTVGGMAGTMSSLEIAKVTGKRHDHVLRDIEKMLNDLGEGLPKFGDTYVNEQNGQVYPCYNLPKRECLILAGGYDVVLRASIIDRWAELEYKEKSGEYSDPVKVAHDRFQYITEKACSVADLLGYSEGHKRKEALEIGVKIEQDTGVHVVPSFLATDVQATNPDLKLSPFHGTHAALVGIGTQGYSASNIAQIYGKDISPTDINNILVSRGYQIRYDRKGKYSPTEKGKIFCNQSTLASGNHEGKLVIKEWLYNTYKALRDEIDDGVEKLRISRKK